MLSAALFCFINSVLSILDTELITMNQYKTGIEIKKYYITVEFKSPLYQLPNTAIVLTGRKYAWKVAQNVCWSNYV